MANEINVGAEETIKTSEDVEVEETKDIESEEETEKSESKEERPKESPEDKLARLERQAKQLRKKLGVEEKKPVTKKEEKQSDEFDEGQLAYLTAKGIEADEDVDFTRDELKKHGGTLRELLNNEYFQAKLKSRRDSAAALVATPSASRRSGTKVTDEVEFHYAKYLKDGASYLKTLPREMREKLVNKRLEQTKNDHTFTDVPVIGA